MKDVDCVSFLQWALPRLRLRWPGYRRVRKQVCKRVGRRMAELGLSGEARYRAYLGRHPEEWTRLDAFCRISISRFFRDREVFDHLGEEVLPTFASAASAGRRRSLRAWSAGCASGEEPYSLMLLWRFLVAPGYPDLSLRVVATDADAHLLERARIGCYAPGTLKELPGPWLQAAFLHRDGRFCLRRDYREGIEFRREDLRCARPKERFDLILCRNLAFTYFDLAQQREVLDRMVEALRPRGALVLGRRERLPEPDLRGRSARFGGIGGLPGIAPWSSAFRVYRRTER